MWYSNHISKRTIVFSQLNFLQLTMEDSQPTLHLFMSKMGGIFFPPNKQMYRRRLITRSWPVQKYVAKLFYGGLLFWGDVISKACRSDHTAPREINSDHAWFSSADWLGRRYLISVLSIVPQKIKRSLSFIDLNYKMRVSCRLSKRDNW